MTLENVTYETLEDVSYEALVVYGQAVWRNYVHDVAVPLGFARPWWEVCLRGAVPLGSAKHAGVKRGVSPVSGMLGGIM